jgi:dTDP-4-amino-4,6-dideoxygalactose transaminase
MNGKPVILGGRPLLADPPKALFHWPIITQEDEAAAIDVLRRGATSGTDVTRQFEAEFAAWQGREYALGYCNGTAALTGALWGCGVGVGDEVIGPSVTYWASALTVFGLGATVVFADIDPETLCLDPNDIEHRITERTKAILVVQYLGHPAAMDDIMAIARKHGVKVIEDFSHAQGGMYKGKKNGSWGDVGAASLMGSKSLAIGESGVIVTDDKTILERAVAFGHYERMGALTDESLTAYRGLPLGGVKHRMHQVSSAVGRVQLKYYDERILEIRAAIDYFWSRLEGAAHCFRPHRIPRELGDMAGWYIPYGHYVPEALGGLPVSVVVSALQKEGVPAAAGANFPLHTHPLLQTADIYGHGKPTRVAFSARDVRAGDASLPVSDGIGKRLLSVPYFKKLNKPWIDKYADAYLRVFANAGELLKSTAGDGAVGGWNLSTRKPFVEHREVTE